MVQDFDIDNDDEPLTLAEVYSYLHLSNRKEVATYLREWFTECTPSWQRSLAEFPFRRIWTLNIDDVIEKAFASVAKPLESLSWNERFSDGSVANCQQIIHLHGSANRLSDQEDNDGVLVFSLSEYAREVANPRTWHKVFHDEIASKPFVIIGAQLIEEIDLIEALERGSAARESTGLPSVLVVPRISDVRRTQIEAYGFVIVESTGEEFIHSLLKQYRQTISNLGGVVGFSTPELLKFQ